MGNCRPLQRTRMRPHGKRRVGPTDGRRWQRLSVAVALAGLFLAGCGGDGGEDTDVDPAVVGTWQAEWVQSPQPDPVWGYIGGEDAPRLTLSANGSYRLLNIPGGAVAGYLVAGAQASEETGTFQAKDGVLAFASAAGGSWALDYQVHNSSAPGFTGPQMDPGVMVLDTDGHGGGTWSAPWTAAATRWKSR